MVDHADLASQIEERERAWLIRNRVAPSSRPPDGLGTTCCVCGGPTIADRDTCTACAARAAEGN